MLVKLFETGTVIVCPLWGIQLRSMVCPELV